MAKLKPGGIINLKTDSPFLLNIHGVSAELNGFEIAAIQTTYGSGMADPVSSIKTY